MVPPTQPVPPPTQLGALTAQPGVQPTWPDGALPPACCASHPPCGDTCYAGHSFYSLAARWPFLAHAWCSTQWGWKRNPPASQAAADSRPNSYAPSL